MSTKNTSYSDARHVYELIGPDTVTTFSTETLAAYRDHGQPFLRLNDHSAPALTITATLSDLGIDLGAVASQLHREGAREFVDRFDHLIAWLWTTHRE